MAAPSPNIALPQEMMSVFSREDTPIFSLYAWTGAGAVAGMAYLSGLVLTWFLCRRRCPDLHVWAGGVILLPPLVLCFYPFISGFPSILRVIGLLGLSIPVFSFVKRLRSGPGTGVTRASATVIQAPLDRVLCLTGWGILCFWLMALVLPAFSPPTQYDVLEYHLGLIPHVFQVGQVEPVPGIFYTAQPMATEMLYLAASVFEGSPWGYAPGLVQWLLVILATMFYHPLAGRLGIPAAWCPWLWLVFLSHPLVFRFQLECLTDWTGVVMLLAGLYVWKCGIQDHTRSGNIPRIFPALMVGLLAGGSVTSKWTNMGTVFLPLMCVLVMMGLDSGAERRFRQVCQVCLAGLVASFIVWLPWGAWLMYHRGNPFSPFLSGVFPSSEWPVARLHFLMETHVPLKPWQTEYWSNLANRLLFDLPGFPLIAFALSCGGLILVLAYLARVRSGAGYSMDSSQRRGFRVLQLLVISVPAGLLLWGQLLHAADRFLAPLMTGAILLSGLAVHSMSVFWGGKFQSIFIRGVGCALVMLFCFQSVGPMKAGRAYTVVATGALTWDKTWDQLLGVTNAMVRRVNRLPDDSRLIILNEARSYFFRHRVSLASVFDESPIRDAVITAKSAPEIREKLVEKGYTHLLVNEFEQARILRMHAPLHLLEDPEFKSDCEIRDSRTRDRRLAIKYGGLTEFSVDPLEKVQLEVYREFLGNARDQALWSTASIGGGDRPAIWMSSLD